MELKDYPQLMTLRETAQYLRSTNKQILKLIATGEIQAVRFGARYKVLRDELIKEVAKAQ